MKTITSIILSHYKERENNLKRIVDDLLSGTIVPDKIIIFIDNPEIKFEDKRATIIRSSMTFLPIIRFALGAVCNTDYCFFIDDDLTVREKTLENFVNHAGNSDEILGVEGNILGKTETPYTNDTPVKREDKLVLVDVIIRTYFVPTKLLSYSLQLMLEHPDLPKKSLDDVFLCLGNKYLNRGLNYVIPVDDESNLTELDEGGVGQTYTGEHYKNRNEVCRKLMDIYE